MELTFTSSHKHPFFINKKHSQLVLLTTVFSNKSVADCRIFEPEILMNLKQF